MSTVEKPKPEKLEKPKRIPIAEQPLAVPFVVLVDSEGNFT